MVKEDFVVDSRHKPKAPAKNNALLLQPTRVFRVVRRHYRQEQFEISEANIPLKAKDKLKTTNKITARGWCGYWWQGPSDRQRGCSSEHLNVRQSLPGPHCEVAARAGVDALGGR